MAKNSIQKMITLNSTSLEKLEEIIKHHGFMGKSDAIRACISRMHEDIFKYRSTKYVPMTPEEKAARSIKAKAIKSEAEQEESDREWKRIADLLGGEVEITTDDQGNKYCKFKNYVLQGKEIAEYDQEVPVEHLTQVLVDNQYDPDKETVLAFSKK